MDPIPKKIHYCWFGGAEYPELVVKCLRSWNILDDYEIVRWDEESDLPDSAYLQNALNASAYSNASNYMRLHALAEFGGVYLDTDIELLRPLDDDLLATPWFFGWQDPYRCNSAIMGAVAGSSDLERLRTRLTSRFDGTELASFMSGPDLLTEYLYDEYGLFYSPDVHRQDEFTAYPEEYFYPVHFRLSYDLRSDRTYADHHWSGLWKSERDQRRPLADD